MNTNTLTIILVIMIILLLYIYYSKHYIESFDNQTSTSGIGFQMGTSDITPTGTITFKTPFNTAPAIFTQIVGSSGTSTNAYSIQIFDVTTTNFNYSKNKLSNDIVTNENVQNANILTLNTSTVEPFTWIAIG